MLIKNVDIITSDSANDILYGASLLIKDNIIEKIINAGEAVPEDENVIDGKGMIAMPGLINTHTHSAMTFLRNYGNDMNLQDWLFKKIFPAEDKLTAEAVYWFNKLAYIEFIRSGITTHADSYFFMESAARAVEEAGLRAVLHRSVSGISDADCKKLKESAELFKNYNNSCDGRINVALGAHAIYTSDEAYLRKVVEEARKIGSGLVTHLSETKKEFEDCISEHKMTPAEYLDSLGYFDCDGIKIAAHCVHMTDNDMDILAEKNVSVIHNPKSNLKLANGIAPIPHLMEKNINICMGTDSQASNNTLNMFTEMNYAALLHKGTTGIPTVCTAREVLDFATVNAAKALGFEKSGAIASGNKADIAILDLDRPEFYPRNDLTAALVYSANGSEVDTVIINGDIVLEKGRLTKFDEEEIYAKAREAAEKF